MPNLSDCCSVCLSNAQELIKTSEKDPQDVKWTFKLAKFVPEIDWLDDYFICQPCTTQLESAWSFRELCLQSHTIETKENVPLDIPECHICSLCDEKFPSRKDLGLHNESKHGLERPYGCAICGESFKTDSELDGHETVHKFHCYDCNTSHSSAVILKTHKIFKHSDRSEWKHECPQCGVKLPLKSHLERHIQRQHEKGPFICFHCDKTFTNKVFLAAHIRLKHGKDDEKKRYKCVKCSKTYATEKSMKTHSLTCVSASEAVEVERVTRRRVKKELEESGTNCDVCGTSFSTKYLLRRHVRNVHATEKKFKCEICGQKFASPVYLSAHKRYHSGDRPHICSFCGKGYITASDLYHHEKIHANKRAYKCDKCPKAFNTSSDLHKHKICVHMDRSEWKYVCGYCGRRFPLKTNLDAHIKTHTGEKNFACHLCDRKCINRSVLQRHIESHSNVRLFKCNVCNQDYKYQKSLDIHLTKAHGIGDAKVPQRVKKYFCHICPKSYFANNKLQKHIRTHTGERPFSCQLCEKRFIDKSYVKQHLKATHNVSFSDAD